MIDIQLSFDNKPFFMIEESFINEGKFVDKFLSFIDKIISSIMSFLKKIRDKIKQYRESKSKDQINNIMKNYNKNNGESIEYYIPNKESIKIYLDSLYVDSYDILINKSIFIANDNKERDLYVLLFSSDEQEKYSDNNDYMFCIRHYLFGIFKKECNNKADLNKCISDMLEEKRLVKHYSLDELKKEFDSTKDIFKTGLGKDIQQIRDIKEWVIDYFTNITNKSLVSLNALKTVIKKNSNNYSDGIKDSLLRLCMHYGRMITDANIEKCIINISNYENDIYNKLKKSAGE